MSDQGPCSGKPALVTDEGCLIKLYDVQPDEFRINDVLEFVGVFFETQDCFEDMDVGDDTHLDDFGCDVSSTLRH